MQGSGLRKVYNARNLNNVKCEYLIYDFGFRFIFHRNNGIINPELYSKLRVKYPNFPSNNYQHHFK